MPLEIVPYEGQIDHTPVAQSWAVILTEVSTGDPDNPDGPPRRSWYIVLATSAGDGTHLSWMSPNDAAQVAAKLMTGINECQRRNGGLIVPRPAMRPLNWPNDTT